jgi:hypothetical protein
MKQVTSPHPPSSSMAASFGIIRSSNAVHPCIVFGPASLKPDGKIERIEIVPPNNYDEQQLPRVKRQLEKASVHLAQLLNSVRFK